MNNNEHTLVSVGKNIFAFQVRTDLDEYAQQEHEIRKRDLYLTNKHLIRAVHLLEKEDDQKALKQLNLALKDDPNNYIVLSYLAILLAKYGNNRKALEAMEKALSLIKDDSFFNYTDMAFACRRLGYAKRGLNYAIKALNLDQENETAAQYIAEYYYSHQNYDMAAEYADQLLAIAPDNPYSYTLKGQIEMNRGNYHSALHLFEHVLELDAQSISAQANYAKALLKTGKEKEAVRLMAKTLKASFERNELNDACAEARKLFCREAITAYQKELERRTVRGKYRDRFMIELAQIYVYTQQFETAALWARESYMQIRDYYLLYLEAYYWWKAEKRQKAFDTLVQMIMDDPDCRYFLEEAASQETADVADFTFLICDAMEHVYPDIGITSFIRAASKEMLGKMTEAIPEYDRLIRLCNGDNVWAEIRRAVAYDQMGCRAKAEEGYRAIIDTPALITNLDVLPLALLFLHGEEALYAPLSKYRQGCRTKKSILTLLDEKIEQTQMKFDQLTYVLIDLKELHLKRAAVRCRIGWEFEAIDDVRWLLEHNTIDEYHLSHCFELQPLIGTEAYRVLMSEFR